MDLMRKYAHLGGWRGGDPPLGIPFELNTDSPQADGLVSWWPGFFSYQNSILHDLGPAANHGAITGQTWAGDPARGVSVVYNNDFVQLGTRPYLTETRPFTFSAWVYLTSFGLGYPHIAVLQTTDEHGYEIALSNDSSYLGLLFGTNIGSGWVRLKTDTASTFWLNAWRHVAIVYNGTDKTAAGSFKAYINGVQQSLTTTPGFDPTTNDNRLGTTGNAFHDFAGRIDYAMLRNRAISGDVIWQEFDPDTRFDLIKPLPRQVWPVAAAPAVGRTTKNTDARPLGIHTGISWRVNIP